MAGLERWHNQRVQAMRKRQHLTTAAQVERSTIPVKVRRDDEIVDVDVPVPDLVQEGVRAGEEADIARGEAAAALSKVSTALTAANDAAQKAAAATETALGFARYSQVDGGPIVPELPVDGPRVGAELVYVDVNGHPYQANVWNGTAWVKNQLLIDQLLSISPDGTIEIGNARLAAPTVIGGEFFGNRFEGSEFEGGLFTLPSIAAVENLFTDPCEVVGPWVGYPNFNPPVPGPTRTTTQKHGGTYSLIPGADISGRRVMSRPVGPFSFPRGGYVSAWVRRTVEGLTYLTTDKYSALPERIAANVWVERRVNIPAGGTVETINVGNSIDKSGTMYVDDVQIVRYVSLAGKAAIDRADSGEARIYSEAADGSRIEFRSSELMASYGSKSAFIRPLSSPAGVHAATMGVATQLGNEKRELYLDVRDTNANIVLAQNDLVLGSLGIRSDGTLNISNDVTIGRGGFRRQTPSADYEFDNGTRAFSFISPLVNPGNTFALKSQLDAWAPIDGTHAWVTATGWEYIRARGKWIVNSTNGEVDITSSLLAAYRGNMSYSVAGGTLFLNINAVGAIGVGQTVVGNLPSELRPAGLMAGAARLSSDYAGSFLVNAAGAVVAATRTGVTHTTATGLVAYATP